MRNLIPTCILSILILFICFKFHNHGYRVLNVLNLPKNSRFYNAKIQSHYNLSYVFLQKRFLGLVFASNYKNGSFALSFENPDLSPFLLSNYELMEFLVTHNLPNPINAPKQPIYEHPFIFYFGIGSVIIFIIKFFIIFFTHLLTSIKITTKVNINKTASCTASYLRRKY